MEDSSLVVSETTVSIDETNFDSSTEDVNGEMSDTEDTTMEIENSCFQLFVQLQLLFLIWI